MSVMVLGVSVAGAVVLALLAAATCRLRREHRKRSSMGGAVDATVHTLDASGGRHKPGTRVAESKRGERASNTLTPKPACANTKGKPGLSEPPMFLNPMFQADASTASPPSGPPRHTLSETLKTTKKRTGGDALPALPEHTALRAKTSTLPPTIGHDYAEWTPSTPSSGPRADAKCAAKAMAAADYNVARKIATTIPPPGVDERGTAVTTLDANNYVAVGKSCHDIQRGDYEVVA